MQRLNVPLALFLTRENIDEEDEWIYVDVSAEEEAQSQEKTFEGE